jgi:hypothetical protein
MAFNDILVISAGAAGLVLAHGLKHRNVPFRIFERESGIVPKSQGYRFHAVDEPIAASERTLSPETWDLLVKTHAIGSPSDLIILDAISGKTLRTIPTHGAMSSSMDRPWLRELLSVGIEEDMHLSKAFQSYGPLDDK